MPKAQAVTEGCAKGWQGSDISQGDEAHKHAKQTCLADIPWRTYLLLIILNIEPDRQQSWLQLPLPLLPWLFILPQTQLNY